MQEILYPGQGNERWSIYVYGGRVNSPDLNFMLKTKNVVYN